jgi:hypothetical protein
LATGAQATVTVASPPQTITSMVTMTVTAEVPAAAQPQPPSGSASIVASSVAASQISGNYYTGKGRSFELILWLAVSLASVLPASFKPTSKPSYHNMVLNSN